MKNKIFIIMLLIISSISNLKIESYAAEAHAYATVLIIIPPREEEAKETLKQENKEAIKYAKEEDASAKAN